MSLLTAYLSRPATQRILSKKPGQKGFTLIELVVVIAILAVLIVVALPNFQGITDDAAVASGKKHLVDAFTECEIARTRNIAPMPSIATPLINRGAFSTPGPVVCPTAGALPQTFTPTLATLPTFRIDLTTGQKTCARATGWGCSAAGTW